MVHFECANCGRDSLWDSFRSQFPFLTLIDPTSVEEMIRSLIDTYSHLGWLPDCRMQLNKGYTQARLVGFRVLRSVFSH